MAEKPQKFRKIRCFLLCAFCSISVIKIATDPSFTGFLNFEFGAILAQFTGNCFGQSGCFLWELRKLLSIDCWCEINAMLWHLVSNFDFWA